MFHALLDVEVLFVDICRYQDRVAIHGVKECMADGVITGGKVGIHAERRAGRGAPQAAAARGRQHKDEKQDYRAPPGFRVCLHEPLLWVDQVTNERPARGYGPCGALDAPPPRSGGRLKIV
jgi:hypothetical protein